jgi:hypothetical protein
MFHSIVNSAALKCFPDSESCRQTMIQDVFLLAQSFKILIPIITIFVLGFSFSIVSLAMQIGLIGYLYRQTLIYYMLIRAHNKEEPNGNPEKELWIILMTTKTMVMTHIL